MNFAPIVLFTFNRLWHTQQTIEALKKNEESSSSELIIYSDGPRSEKDIEKVLAVRNYLSTVSGFKSVKIFESQFNKGLAKSIISGVTQTLKNHETVIILEDDMITSPYFLTYMNQALALYQNETSVISIHGYQYPVDDHEFIPETFFLKGAECWGWATWRRGWKLFDRNPWKLLGKIILNNKINEFDIDGSYPYTRMLFSQCIGRIDSWAIRWYASAFLANKVTLYPKYSLIQNIGLDDTGTHNRSWARHVFETSIHNEDIQVKRIDIKENQAAREALSEYFKKTQIPLIKKIKYTLLDFLKKNSNQR